MEQEHYAPLWWGKSPLSLNMRIEEKGCYYARGFLGTDSHTDDYGGFGVCRLSDDVVSDSPYVDDPVS